MCVQHSVRKADRQPQAADNRLLIVLQLLPGFWSYRQNILNKPTEMCEPKHTEQQAHASGSEEMLYLLQTS